MTEAVLSVCWKDHTNELATVYTSLLENNVLVDCTISTGTGSLKAHRLVLCACSPYFHKLFSEQTGKHSYIILLDASFETLKAVIDFIYRGETQILEKNLKAFLILAQFLQIKGINAYTEGFKNKNLSSNPTQNAPPSPFDNNQFTFELENIRGMDSLNNYPQQHPPFLDCYPDAVHTKSFVPFEGDSASCQGVQTPQEYQEVQRCEEVAIETEITVKHELLDAIFSKSRNDILDDVTCGHPTSLNFTGQIIRETASTFGDQVLKHEASAIPNPQQQLIQLRDEVPYVRDVGEEDTHLLPEIFVPKCEHRHGEESEEPMDDLDVTGRATNERDEGAEPEHGEESPVQHSSAEGLFPGKDVATQQRSGKRPPTCPAEKVQPPPSRAELQLHEGRRGDERQHSREEPLLSAVGRKALAGGNRVHMDRRPHRCDVCGKEFSHKGNLVYHMRTHTGERPHRCDICGKAFSLKHNLATHMHTHTRDRPHRCCVCEKTFVHKCRLVTHMQTHTQHRQHRCGVCGKEFTLKQNLVSHINTHTREGPQRCGECEKHSYTNVGSSLVCKLTRTSASIAATCVE